MSEARLTTGHLPSLNTTFHCLLLSSKAMYSTGWFEVGSPSA